MLNLLPPQQKKELLEEENWKLTLILMTVFTFFLTALFFVLLLINIIILSNLEIQRINLSQQGKTPDNLQAQILEKDLADFNQTISGLDIFYQNQFVITDTIAQISKLLLSSDLYLTDFSFVSFASQQKEFIGQISLSGFASKRNSLMNFKKELEKIENFQEINFPSSNWIRPININFTVNLKIK